MEILSYVLSGSLSHKDSEGNVGVIRNGDVQRMTAGTGIMHSEFNASTTEPVHFLQIWIVPAKRGSKPRYEDRNFPIEKRKNKLCLIASPDEAEGSLSIDQDAHIYATVLDAGSEVTYKISEGRGIWVQVAWGAIRIGYGANDWASLKAGDGAALQGEPQIVIHAEEAAEFLLFDLA